MSKAPEPLPKVRRTRGPKGVRQLALYVIQQQLESMKERKMTGDERDFAIAVAKALAPAAKHAEPPDKEPKSPQMRDPLNTLGE